MASADLRAADADEIKGFAAVGGVALAAIVAAALAASGGATAIEYVAGVPAGLWLGSHFGARAWIWAARAVGRGRT